MGMFILSYYLLLYLIVTNVCIFFAENTGLHVRIPVVLPNGYILKNQRILERSKIRNLIARIPAN